MDNLAEIRSIPGNASSLDDLVTQLRTALGVLPFVGAGLSMPFGFKGWQQFLLAVANSPQLQEKVKQRLDQGQYEEAAQDILDVLGSFDFQAALESEFGEAKLSHVSPIGAVSYLPRLASGPVITTNFDRVLEKVFEDSNARFEERIWGPLPKMAARAVMQNRRYLLKLHGDVLDDTARVLTLAEYERTYAVDNNPAEIDLRKPLPALLYRLLISRPVLFLGCSLHRDRIVQFIQQIGGSSAGLSHWAVLEHPGDEGITAANRRFGDYGIRRIWYPKGKHEYVERILQYLDRAIEAQPIRTMPTPPKAIAVGMKAPEAFEIVIRKHPEIESFTIIRYRDKPRLPERATVQPDENASQFLSEAAVHDDKADQEQLVAPEELGPEFWERIFKLPTDFVLAASSKVQLKDGSIAHLPMIDFKCSPSDENISLAKEAFEKIGQKDGVLLNSGNSFHYYGQTLMDEVEWRKFLGHCLLLADFIDTRYVGHALINNECRLRLSTAPLNAFIPKVVEVF